VTLILKIASYDVKTIGIKIGLGVIVLAFIVWLALTPLGRDQRFALLQDLFRSQQLGRLSPEETQTFQTLVTEAISSAGIVSPVVLNSDPKQGALHFFVSDPTVLWFTHCKEGNAIYDAELDVVFVDRSLFQQTELTKLGHAIQLEKFFPQEFAFSRTFLSLILLHELGHRQLHRTGLKVFDNEWNSSGRDKEIEADDFAVQSLERAYAERRLTIDSAVLAEIQEAGIGNTLTLEQQFVAALLYATSQMSVGLLFSRGSFSSFSEDPNHPSYGERVRRIGSSLSNLAEGDPTLVKYLDYFRRVSARIESLRQQRFIEVQSEHPIAAVAFDDKGLLVFDRLWNVAVVSNVDIHSSGRHVAIKPRVIGHVERRQMSDQLLGLWSLKGHGTFGASSGEVFQVVDSQILARPDLSKLLQSWTTPLTAAAIEPASFVVHDDGSTLTFFQADQVIGTTSWSVALATTKDSQKAIEPTVKNVYINDNEIIAVVLEKHGPLVGVLRINCTPPFKSHFVPLQVSDDIDLYGQLAAIRTDNSYRYFLFGKLDLFAKVSVWELFEDRSPILRSTYSPLLFDLTDLPFSGQNVPVVVTKVRVAGDNSILISLAGDSIVRFDEKSNEFTPVFHPATAVNITLAQDGTVAVSVFNGYKAFLIPR
jgi:hypothetical protein